MITTLGSDQVLIWPFRPQGDHTESMEFLTDVLSPYSQEQRISLRTKPRQQFQYPYIMDAKQYSRTKAFMQNWGANLFAVPVWHEATSVSGLSASATEILFDTDYADYRDSEFALVWAADDDFEAVTIDTVLADRITLTGTLQNNYTRAFVMPLRKARMPNLSVDASRSKGVYSDVTARFFITDTTDLSAEATPYTSHDGYQVMEDRPVVIASIDESVIWPQEVFDNSTGNIAIDPLRAQAFQSYTATWETSFCGQRRSNLWAIRTWLHSMRGRALAFWMPSYNADLKLTADIGASDTDITIEDIGFSTYYITAEIMILLKDGTRYYRSVTGSVDNMDGTESLTIAALGSAVAAADVDIISIMTLSRLNSDRIEIAHRNNGSSIRIPVIEVPVPV